MNYKLKYLKYKLKYLKNNLKYQQIKGGMLEFDSEQEIQDSIYYIINYLDIELNKEYSFQQDGYETDDDTDDIKCTVKKNSIYYYLYNNIKNFLIKILIKIDNKKKLRHHDIIGKLNKYIFMLKQEIKIELTQNQTITLCSISKNKLIDSLNSIMDYFKKDFSKLLTSKLESLSSESQ